MEAGWEGNIRVGTVLARGHSWALGQREKLAKVSLTFGREHEEEWRENCLQYELVAAPVLVLLLQVHDGDREVE
jgi:hypothetical protein